MRAERGVKWPSGNRCAVAITFDPDAEGVWFFNPENLANAKTMSLGHYGVKRGLPRVLDLLDRNKVPSTFFTLGWYAETYPEAVKEMAKRGHEVAAHGYRHENLGKLDQAETRDVLRKNRDAIRNVIGKDPIGMRAHGDYKDWVFKIMQEEGFVYDSSMKDDDRPYRMTIDGNRSNFIQIPFRWELDDFPYYGFEKNHLPVGTARMQNASQAFDAWKQEFDGYYKSGLCFCLCLHPQISCTPGRIIMLENFIRYVKTRRNIWFARMGEIAEFWRKNEQYE